MRKFTKSLLTLALLAMGVLNVNAATKIDGGIGNLQVPKTYSNIGAWGGTWSGNSVENEKDWTAYEYVWIKYKDFDGAINFGVMYSEFKSHESWGDSYYDATVALKDQSGVIGIKLDQTSTYVKGNKDEDGDYKGDVYAKHIREVFIQATAGGSSVTIEEMWVGTEAEYNQAVEDNKYVEVFVPDTEDPGVAAIPAGNISLINNGTLEGTDMGSFFTKVNKGGATPSVTTDGAGRFGGKGIKITSIDNASDGWDTQFWVKFNRNLPSGTKIHIEFQHRSSEATTISSQQHSQTCGYLWYAGLNSVNPSINWKNFSQDFTITKGDKDALLNVGSIAFNLNDTKDKAIDFYFDNFLVYAEAKEFTVKEAGWGTFSFDKAVSFGDDVEAYTATYSAGKLTLNPVTTLAANKGIIIKAAAGDYNAVVNDGSGVAAADNDLLVSDGNVAGDGSIYVLANGASGAGFYKLANGEKVPAGKAYLTIDAGAPEFIGFNGTTGIETAKAVKANNGEYYNLAGQRVAQPTKGLYIVNGKKVILK